MTDCVSLKYKNLPCAIGAFTVERDNYYTVVVNARSSYDQQQKSIAHELEHIENGDFDYIVREGNVDLLELERHHFKR
jgi:hypothetical protein